MLHLDEWIAALIIDASLFFLSIYQPNDVFEKLGVAGANEAEGIPPVVLQADNRVLEVDFVVLNLLARRINWDLGVILIHYLLSVGERVIEVLQDLERLKVLLFVINDCLESSVLADFRDFISQSKIRIV